MTGAAVARPELLIATRNRGKAVELGALVEDYGYRVVSLADLGFEPNVAEDDVETYATFEENARAKAQYYHRLCGGYPTVADDSGLEVAALGGAPGVRSRRWTGATGTEAQVAHANNQALLRALDGVRDRSARLVCAVALADAHGTLVCRGEVRGRISTAPRGEYGFGYDPVFEADDLAGRTLGEVPPRAKRSVSHRTRAFAALARALRDQGDVDGGLR